jgi:hypothetical protein
MQDETFFCFYVKCAKAHSLFFIINEEVGLVQIDKRVTEEGTNWYAYSIQKE